MTINTSSVRELDIETIIRRAYQLAGLMNANESSTDPNWAAKFAMAADFLDVELKGLQANAAIQRHQRFVTEVVTPGSAVVTYASSMSPYIDFNGPASFTRTGDTTSTPVIPMDAEAYMAITDKTTTGRPTSYLFQRGTTNTLTLWPVPDEGGTLTLIAHVLVADADDQSATVDLERHWTKYLIYSLAGWLAMANSLPLNVSSKFESMAEAQFKIAKGYSKSAVASQIVSTHRTAWSR